MVVYGLALGNQLQLNGGDFSTRTAELWPPAAPWMEIAGEFTLSTPTGQS